MFIIEGALTSAYSHTISKKKKTTKHLTKLFAIYLVCIHICLVIAYFFMPYVQYSAESQIWRC